MKLTKKLETEILKVYNTYCNAIIKGDVTAMAACLDVNFQIIGSAEGEVFLNKKEAMKFYNATADQIAGKVELRNRKIKTTPIDNLIFISETCDMYALIEEKWVFYSKFRLTSLLQKIGNAWKFVQVHASIPDSKTEEGEQLALKKIQKENLELRDAVKRRTAELEQKNRELEIEAALERVRSLALSMHKSGEVGNVTDRLFEELNKLTLKVIGCTIVVIDESKDTWETWRARTKVVVKPFEVASFKRSMQVLKKHLPKWFPVFNEALSAREKYLIEEMTKRRRTQLLNSIAEQYNYTEKEKSRLLKITPEKITAHFLFFKLGYLALITEKRLPDENLAVAGRFVEVFDFAYTRFLDIKNAEEQAREAEIQLALERVRARTMAMQKSDELAEAASLLFKQVSDLGTTTWSSGFHIWHPDNISTTAWMSAPDGSILTPFTLAYDKDPFFKKIFKARQGRKDFFVMETGGKELAEHYRYMLSDPDNKRWFDNAKNLGFQIPKFQITHCAFFSQGYLMFISYEPCPEMWDIFRRFAKVFQQTYTRFLDLKKAEEQTKEAQIQASLERVRASAMAMHKSEELLDVCETMFKEFLSLGFDEIRNAIINIHNDADNSFINYDYAEVAGKSVNRFTNDVLPFVSKMMTISHSANDAFSEIHISGKTLAKFRDLRKQTGQRDEPRLNKAKSLYFYFYSIGIGAIGISTYGPINTDKKTLLKRFRDVFNLSYKRYIDISKAEAQAREAEIQLALERVRARTMAMHNSDELAETAGVLFQQFVALGITPKRCFIGIIDKDKKSEDVYLTSSEGKVILGTDSVPMMEQKYLKEVYNAWKNKKEHLSYRLQGQQRVDWTTYMMNKAKLSLPEYTQDKLNPEQVQNEPAVFNYFFFSTGHIGLHTVEDITETEVSMLKRFSAVFEQTYTRFLDLQKAEAHARESEIQLALERVRARTMAMQKSDELLDAASLLFHQVKELGCDPFSCGFVLLDKNKSDGEFFMSAEGKFQPSVFIPNGDESAERNMYLHWVKGAKLYTEDAEGEELVKHFEYLMSLPGKTGETFRAMKNAGIKFPEWQRWHAAYFFQGYLLFITKEPFEETGLFPRFASVFEQTYTRFLDLQKAEAQAIEAQIEAALEKVRSRSLAMHRADELKEVVIVLAEKLQELGVVLDANGLSICTYFPDSKDVLQWQVSTDFKDAGSYLLPYFDHPIFNDAWESKESGAEYFSKSYTVQEKNSFFEYAFEHSDFKTFPDEFKQWAFQNDKHILSFAWQKNSAILIPSNTGVVPNEEQKKILVRFAKVFEQAYIRFLDLQKAEAQAREAQIEAALERVRSRSMAMHKSDEISAVASVLFHQLQQLNIPALRRCLIGIVDESNENLQSWYTSMQGDSSHKIITYPISGHPVIEAKIKSWREKKPFSIELTGKKMEDFFQYTMSHGFELPKGEVAATHMIQNHAPFKYGYLEVATHETITDQNFGLLKRFANVFEQTYTRFLDLQKAEAQAREAQIEAALERVRSRTIGMQKSEELKEVIQLVYEQFVHLNIHIEHTGFILDYKTREDLHIWLADQREIPSEITIPCFDSPPNNSIKEAKEKGQDFFRYILGFEEKNKFYHDLFKYIPGVPEESLKYYFNCPGLAGSGVLLENIGLYIENFSGTPFTDEENKILMRFGKVFQQTYTRFLDLQKAEAQTREARIEAALEKVRARTMGMQHSSELQDASYLLFQQVLDLGVPAFSCGYNIWENGEKECTAWMSDPSGGGINPAFKIPLTEDPNFIRFQESKQKKEEFYVLEMRGERMQGHYQYLRKTIPVFDEAFKKAESAGLTLPETQIHHLVNFDHGNVMFITLEPCPEAHGIFKRFGKVFEQTYTRFLDLKKAEEQAREARIEAALEKVRSRSLAMHSTNELGDVVTVIVEKLKDLGVVLDANGVVLCTYFPDSKDVLHWIVSPDFSFTGSYLLPYFDHPIFNDAWQSKESGVEYFSKAFTVEEKNSFFEYAFEHSDYKLFPDEFKQWVFQNDKHILSFAWQKNSAILIPSHTGVVPSEDDVAILKRFAKVFEQSYVRFLDLQKAEIQAREAQIEAALERVRSRTMGMQRSEELQEAAVLLFQQVVALGVPAFATGFSIWDDDRKFVTSWMGQQDRMQPPFKTSSSEDIAIRIFEAAEKGESLFVEEQGGEALRKHYEYLNSIPVFTEISKKMTEEGITFPTFQIMNCAFFSNGYLTFITYEPVPDSYDIFRRFAKVFEQTYTRFLDLQKAEAQAREAQIEAALERVRSRTMGMQKSDELQEAAVLLFQQVVALGVPAFGTGFNIWDDDRKHATAWMGGQDRMQPPFKTSSSEDIFLRIYEAAEKGETLFVEEQGGEALKIHYEYMISIPVFKEIANKMAAVGQTFPTFQIMHCAFFSHGYLMFISFEPVPSAYDIFKRFAKVFEQTYTRFLDLQKAEAQAREAQIETALERVRSRSMAMHHTSELQEVINTVAKQFQIMQMDINGGVFISINDDVNKDLWFWGSFGVADSYVQKTCVPFLNRPIFSVMIDAIKNRKGFVVEEYTREEKVEFFNHLFKHPPFSLTSPERKEELLSRDGGYTRSIAVSHYTSIFMINHFGKKFSDSDNEILKRFGKVFEQSYIRFLDLQKAEAQAHEAKIEAALERVRNRTMAMQHSDELAETAGVLFEQFVLLGIEPKRCVIGIIDQTRDSVKLWFTSSEGKIIPGADLVPLNEQENLKNLYKSWKNHEQYFRFRIHGQERVEWTSYMVNNVNMHLPEYQPGTINMQLLLNEPAVFNSFFFNNGFVMLHTVEDLYEKYIPVLKRFTAVFEQSYTRFLDLKNAEARARESKIEAALEKVRSRAMAMHSSEDLSAAVNVFFKELKLLGLVPRRCGVAIINESTHRAYNMLTTATSQGDSFEVTGEANLDSHPLLTDVLNNWKEQKEYFPVLNPVEMKEYYRILKPQVAVTDFKDDAQYGYYLPFKEGVFYVWTDKGLKEEDLSICRRFTSVIGLTYRRYLDLKEAERRAFEAVRQASLDRVRAEIASMRTSDDLNRITPIIWRELKALEVPFIRCGVFIIDEEQAKTMVYLTTPDGKSLGVLNLSFDANELTVNTVNHWRKKQVYKEHWNREEFINWTKSMMELGQVQNAETYQGSSAPPESLHLHFVPFAQGMLYVGDVSPLTDEKLDLVKTLAEAFSIAYARYEDFKNLEEAKNKIELTFNELKSAQAQLIHAEKLASLGELTAGIAHEIKNPLNFVNNFSELSKELLDEIKTELENNNKEEILAILEDLKLNLEKINDHGKRADSIVKGMLLHSRGTSGEKTLTDINDLLDQYINLAYHGMRAQNKEFNITIEKDYDKSLEKINVVPQDISRVFLNIINNACYAAYDKKKKSSDNNFSPTLKVSTKSLNGKIEIRIVDNGNGIPDNILDKIFQPFFTTKPTGEGTGLGLSLSYDIVTKVHNGELKVETKEGEGTEFVIQLPLS